MITKIIQFVKTNREDVLLFIAVMLVSMFSFSLGFIVAKMEEKESLQFEQPIYSDKEITEED